MLSIFGLNLSYFACVAHCTVSMTVCMNMHIAKGWSHARHTSSLFVGSHDHYKTAHAQMTDAL